MLETTIVVLETTIAEQKVKVASPRRLGSPQEARRWVSAKLEPKIIKNARKNYMFF